MSAHIKRETLWFIATAMVVAVLQALVTFDASRIERWDTWAIALGSAAVRAGATAGVAAFAASATEGDPAHDADPLP